MAAPSNARPQCSVFIAVSLDGYIARSDGSVDWLDQVQLEGEDYGYQEFFDSVDALLLGRHSYDVVLGFPDWLYTGKRTIVLTHRSATSLHGEEFFSGEVAQLVDKLGREGIRRLYVDGGNVIQQFLKANLIDDMTISIIPTLLGSGIPLFASGLPEQSLKLTSSQSWSSGLVQLRYQVERPAGED